MCVYVCNYVLDVCVIMYEGGVGVGGGGGV